MNKNWLAIGLSALAVAGFAWAQQRATVVIPTGSTGGVFFFYGTSLADILSKNNVANANAVQTGGSYDNILLMRDRTDPASSTYYCGLTTTDAAFVTYTGQEPRFTQKKADQMRMMFYMYPSFIHVVTTSATGIKIMQDLKGKRISTGQPGSSTENLALLVLQGAGVKPEQFSKRERLPAAESAKALAEGSIDAYFWVGGTPTGSIVELGQTLGRTNKQLVMVPIDPQSTTAQIALKRFPGIIDTVTIPKRIYNTAGDVRGLQTGNIMFCPASMPDDLAYNITKTVFGNINTLRTAVASAKDTSLDTTAKMISNKFVVPAHPGALKYLREAGAIK
jgi:uncharacterized protein